MTIQEARGYEHSYESLAQRLDAEGRYDRTDRMWAMAAHYAAIAAQLESRDVMVIGGDVPGPVGV
jgi:hypothetical protein